MIVLNYHRVTCRPDPPPPHMLHTVLQGEFERQIDRCQQLGAFVAVEDVLEYNDLGERAFVVTFDDVPAVSLGAMELLDGRGIPYVVSVCGRLAEEGRGWRDKVYLIARHAARSRVLEAVAAVSDRPPASEGFSFYDFTKSAALHPDQIERDLVDVLFDELPPDVRATLSCREYADWPALSRLAGKPLVTLSNHSWSHANFEALTSGERRHDVKRAHSAIEDATGCVPRTFTVPFGYVRQELLIDLTRLLRELGYRTVLWTEGHANLVVEPHIRRETLHLLRIDAAPTLAGFASQLARALAVPLVGPVGMLPRTDHRQPVTVSRSSDRDQSALLETLMRPEKDYAASPEFYDYAFTSSPFRGQRPDYVLATSSTGPEAVAYRFHSSFVVAGAEVDGLYIASWRRLPRAARMASSAVLRTLVSHEAVVGAYKPSLDAAPAFRGWTAVIVRDHTIALAAPERPSSGGMTQDVAQFDAYDCSLDGLAHEATSGRFSVARTEAFYRWRVDRYPLARPSYVVLCDGSQPVAYAALLTLRESAAVADFYAPDLAHFAALVEVAFAAAWRAGARSASLDTSSSQFSQELTRRYGGRCVVLRNYYRLAGELLERMPACACPGGVWDERFVHETQVTGDVLLR